MKYHKDFYKFIESFHFIERCIASSSTVDHIQTCLNLIKNFERMFNYMADISRTVEILMNQTNVKRNTNEETVNCNIIDTCI